MTNISFPTGPGAPVIASNTDPTIKNVASTKQSVNATTGLLIAGDDATDYYFHILLDELTRLSKVSCDRRAKRRGRSNQNRPN